MSAIEVAAMEPLTELIERKESALDPRGERAIANWLSLKCALSMHAFHQREEFYEGGWAQEVFEHQGQPDSWHSRIGRTSDHDELEMRPGQLAHTGLGFTAAIYGFIGQVWSVPEPTVVVTNSNYFYELNSSDLLSWPPPMQFTSADVQRALIDFNHPH